PAAGIAISSSIVCFITVIFYFIILKKKIKNLHGLSIIKSLLRTTFLAGISGIAIIVMFQKLNNFIIVPTIFNQIIKVSSSAITGIVVFTVMAFLLKLEEAQKIYVLLKAKLEKIIIRI
ncbi:MAG: hypothetical protein AB1349_08310, partial [Elusimicrobiota bacterium]